MLPPLSPWVLLVVLGLSIGLYAGSLSYPFVFDDRLVIVDNPIVERGDIGEIFSTGYWAGTGSPGLERQKLFRPLTILSFAWTEDLFGPDPAAFRAVNLVLHVLCCVLVYFVARRLFAHRFGAGVAAVLFAAHPVHTEAVTYVSGRADLLATVGFLTAWWAHLARERCSLAAQVALLLLSLLAFAGGLLSKEMAITLPAALILGDLLRWQRRGATWRETLRRLGRRAANYAPYVGVIAGVLALRYQAIAALTPPAEAIPRLDNPLSELGPFQRLDDALAILGREIGLLVYPRFLSIDYSYDAIPVSPDLLPSGESVLWVAVCLVTALAGLAAFFVRGWMGFGVSVAFFFVTMLPVSNLFVIIGTHLGERILYLPSLGICLAFATLIRAASRTGPVAAVIATSLTIILVVTGAVRTIVRNQDYESPRALFGAAVRTYPDAARAQFNYGRSLLEDARQAIAAGERGRGESDLAAARDAFERVLEIDPTLPQAHWALGNLARFQGDLSRALERYQAAHRVAAPGDELLSEIAWATTEVALALGRPELARSELERMTENRPSLELVRRAGLGLLALESGDRQTAITALESALELEGPPSPARGELRSAALITLARAYELEGQLDEAERLLQRAVRSSGAAGEARLALAELWLRRGDPTRAAADLGLARDLQAGAGRVAALEAQLLWARGERRQALAAAERALENQQRDELRFHVANWHLQLASTPGADPAAARADLEAARLQLEKYLGDDEPGDRRARFNLGLVLERLGRWSDAIESYLMAAATGGRPEFRARTQAGELYVLMGDLERARDELERATALRPGHAPAWLARARSAATDRERQQTLQLARDAGASPVDIAWARLQSPLEQLERLELLEDVTAASSDLDDPRVLLARSELELRLEDFGAAETAAEEALEVLVVGRPEFGQAWLLLSKVSFAARNDEEAKKRAQIAASWQPENPDVRAWIDELSDR